MRKLVGPGHGGIHHYNSFKKADQVPASGVTVAELPTATYNQLQEFINTTASSGIINGGSVSNGGGATIDVAAGTGLIRATDSGMAELLAFDLFAETGLSIPTDENRYVGIQYNSGSPNVVLKSTNDFNGHTEIYLALVTNEGGDLNISNAPVTMGDAMGHMMLRTRQVEGVRRDNQLGGLILGETGTRNITISSGALWNMIIRQVVAAKDTSASDTFTNYFSDGAGGFTLALSQSSWNNTFYDDGSGSLATLTNTSKYAVKWFYLTLGGGISCMYGTAQYNSLAAAEKEQPRASLPLRVSTMSILLGRLIFKKSASTAEAIESAFDTAFGGAIISNHNDLNNLDWLNTGHTGTANKYAGFDSSGVAAELDAGSGDALDLHWMGF